MSFEDEFNPQQVAAQCRDQYLARMRAQMSADEAETLSDYLGRMAEVAANFIFNERVIKIQEDQPGVPIDIRMARQMMLLFSEGMYFGIIKSHPLEIPDDFRTFMLQNLAGVLFENAKQMALTTYGQEDTPGVMISDAQQIEMISQTADNALTYYCGEYEKQHGPIQLKEAVVASQPAPPPALPAPIEESPPSAPQPPAPPPSAVSAPSPAPPSVATPIDYERYAALALFVSTLPEARRRAILERMAPQERQVVAHYAAPENLDPSLNLQRVVRHLARLKQQFAETQGLNETRKAMLTLATRWQPQALRAITRHERPAIRAYIEGILRARPDDASPLSPDIEAALYAYLQSQSA